MMSPFMSPIQRKVLFYIMSNSVTPSVSVGVFHSCVLTKALNKFQLSFLKLTTLMHCRWCVCVLTESTVTIIKPTTDVWHGDVGQEVMLKCTAPSQHRLQWVHNDTVLQSGGRLIITSATVYAHLPLSQQSSQHAGCSYWLHYVVCMSVFRHFAQDGLSKMFAAYTCHVCVYIGWCM